MLNKVWRCSWLVRVESGCAKRRDVIIESKSHALDPRYNAAGNERRGLTRGEAGEEEDEDVKFVDSLSPTITNVLC